MTNGITAVEMAGAYATIQNGGVHRTPLYYSKITDNEGNIYYNLANASFGNNFYFGFDINKEMLEEKQLFLNVKIDGKIYTEELIK